MLLDAIAIRSLELLANSEGGLPGSLLHLLDRAATPAGRRKVRQLISNPLYRQAAAVLLRLLVDAVLSVCSEAGTLHCHLLSVFESLPVQCVPACLLLVLLLQGGRH